MASLLGDTDFTKFRYVLYARKSTEDEGSQMRSIKDQIKVCKEYAERNNLNVVAIIKEDKSAKVANKRSGFNEVVSELETKDGKYDAILSYAPDRLARNMLEGGLLINLVDDEKIKDLKFPTHHFTNDPSGKLTLGIMFSISKHFSDALSRGVKRGNQGNLEEGISAGVARWGYDRDANGHDRPNEMFDLIKEGWEMRASGETIASVVKFWKRNNVHRMTKINRKNKVSKRKEMTYSTATKLFKSPFYYGILVQSEQEVDLRLLPINFEPMISEELYNQVQSLSENRSKLKPKTSKKGIFYPFRNMVFCGVCRGDIPMRPGKNKSSSGSYGLTYRCDNKPCDRKVKSVRAKYILDDLYKVLDTLKFTEKEYNQYSKRMEEFTAEKIVELRTEKRSLTGRKSNLESSFKTKSRQLAELGKSSPAFTTLETDLEVMQDELLDLEDEIAKIEAKLVNPTKIKMTKDKFLNLANTASDKMRAGTPLEKDVLARIMLLNFTIDDERAPSYLWKEPFDSLLKAKNIRSGARERT
ncbi:TPA: hypothetical protein EYO12_02340 [Candidatus Saccharibacteria bacterium]|nr:hypothetical protein [Candidatus Saccharibacteria bacterium]HIO87659.1 hypothetical protein [Candidatus Saccharibacteria bacterium]